MDPIGAAIVLAVICLGSGIILSFQHRGWPERIAGLAILGVLAPLAFWAFSSGWVWAFVAAAVVGWAVWCALRLVCALLA